MAVVRVYQPHTLDFFARNVMDANAIVGERIVYCEMWNTQNAPKGLPRCKYCYDDVYAESDTTNGICKHCFGTTYIGGIKCARFTHAIVGAPDTTSLYDKAYGEFDAANYTCQVADDVVPHEKDYVLRIAGWILQDKLDTLTVGDAAYMTVAEFAAYGGDYIKGLKAVYAQSYKVRRSFNDGYLKDGFRYLGQANRLGAQIPLALTDQGNPISDLDMHDIPGRLVSTNAPFVAYSPYADDVPQQFAEDGAMTVGEMANYTVGHFKQ